MFHPQVCTSAALTEVMRQKPHMMAALIRGAPINTILGSFTCEGSPLIRDALVIPTALDDALVTRLGHKRERDEEDESDTDWTHIVTQKKEESSVPPAPAATRSIFDDIDK